MKANLSTIRVSRRHRHSSCDRNDLSAAVGELAEVESNWKKWYNTISLASEYLDSSSNSSNIDVARVVLPDPGFPTERHCVSLSARKLVNKQE